MLYNAIYKIIIIGDSGVGKSSLLHRYINNYYNDDSNSTIAIDLQNKVLNIEDKKIKLQIWDTAGQEKYSRLIKCYYKGARGILLCFDITNNNSFLHLTNWFKKINENIQLKNAIIFIVGTKKDLENRVVDYDIALEFAKENNAEYYEISAKESTNIDELFTNIVKKIIKYDNHTVIDITDNEQIIQLDNNYKKKLSCCYKY